MKKNQAVLALVMIFTLAMNTACNENQTKTFGQSFEPASVEVQSEAVSAKVDLNESIEALAVTQKKLDQEVEAKNLIEEYINLEADEATLNMLTSDLKKSEIRTNALIQEIMWRKSAVEDKKTIYNMSVSKLSDKERSEVDLDVVKLETVDKDAAVVRNTQSYEATIEFIGELTDRVDGLSQSIESRQADVDWGYENDGREADLIKRLETEIVELKKQRAQDMKTLTVMGVLKDTLAQNVEEAM